MGTFHQGTSLLNSHSAWPGTAAGGSGDGGVSMRDISDHPVIASIERTGYPPWIKDEPDDDIHALDCFEDDSEEEDYE